MSEVYIPEKLLTELKVLSKSNLDVMILLKEYGLLEGIENKKKRKKAVGEKDINSLINFFKTMYRQYVGRDIIIRKVDKTALTKFLYDFSIEDFVDLTKFVFSEDVERDPYLYKQSINGEMTIYFMIYLSSSIFKYVREIRKSDKTERVSDTFKKENETYLTE